MALTFLDNTSPGAPTFNGAVGSLTTLLDWLLVTKLGWTKAFSGTNLAAYRPTAGNRFYLGVDDTTTLNARIRGFETMTAAGVAVASGAGPFPTEVHNAGGFYAYKSSDTTTARLWRFASDGLFFYLFIQPTGVTYGDLITFGDTTSYAVSDAYATAIGGALSTAAMPGGTFVSNPNSTSSYAYQSLARSYTQVGAAVKAAKLFTLFPVSQTGQLGAVVTGVAYPSPIDGALYAQRVYLTEAVGPRGPLPGLWAPGHDTPLNDKDTFVGSGDLAGRTFVTWSTTTWQIFLETSDTWRT